MSLARFVTDFADEALLLPLATVVALLFLLMGWRRGALAWVLAIGATLGSMLLLKLMSVACSKCWFGPDLTSPSGHTAAGAAIYGGLAALLLPHHSQPRRALPGIFACALGLACLIGGTRLALEVHTVAEVVIGGLVGMAGAVAFVLGAGPRPPPVRAWYPLALVLAVAALLHGLHLPAESNIRRFALDWWPMCQRCR